MFFSNDGEKIRVHTLTEDDGIKTKTLEDKRRKMNNLGKISQITVSKDNNLVVILEDYGDAANNGGGAATTNKKISKKPKIFNIQKSRFVGDVPMAGVRNVAFMKTRKTNLAIFVEGGSIFYFDTKKKKISSPGFPVINKKPLLQFEFTSNDNYLCGIVDTILIVFDTIKKTFFRRLHQKGNCTAMRCINLHGEDIVLVGCDNGWNVIWDIDLALALVEICLPDRSIIDLHVTHKDLFIIASTVYLKFLKIDLNEGQLIECDVLQETAIIQTFDVDKNDEILILSLADGTICFYDFDHHCLMRGKYSNSPIIGIIMPANPSINDELIKMVMSYCMNKQKKYVTPKITMKAYRLLELFKIAKINAEEYDFVNYHLGYQLNSDVDPGIVTGS